MKQVTCVLAVVVAVLAVTWSGSEAEAAALAIGEPVPVDSSDAAAAQAYEYEVPVADERSGRHTRATCDLLSFTSKWISVNHSACAAHCLALRRGFKGGRCQNAVCVCRK